MRAAAERTEAQRSIDSATPETTNQARAALPVAPQAAMRGAVAETRAEADGNVAAGGVLSEDQQLALAERYFPEGFAESRPSLRPWILFDAHGQVSQTGRRAWQGTGELQSYLEQSLPGVRIARATAGTVRNGRGQSADYVLLWMAADSAPGTAR